MADRARENDFSVGTRKLSANDQGEPSDHSLLRRLRQGNEDAATRLYVRYAGRLRALVEAKTSTQLARRVDAEDIVQSVFKSFFRKASHGYYDVPAGDELWKLFLVISLNKIRTAGTFHRAAKRDVRLTVGQEGLAHEYDRSHPDEVAHIFLKLSIDEVLEQLPAAHKAMIEFRIEGSSVAEIAAKTKRSKRTVERVLQECREKLKGLLHDENH